MKILDFNKELNLRFAVTHDGRLLICDAENGREYKEIEENVFFTPVELHTTGKNPNDHHGAKHTGNDVLYYDSHTETDSKIEFVLKNDKVLVKIVYEFFKNIKVVRSHSEIKNISNEDVGVEYLSSFCLYDIKPEKIYIPHNSWCRELNWKEYTPDELGYTKTNKFSTKRIAIFNTGTWSTKEYLPMGIIEEQERTVFWQIEHNGSWNWEISDIEDLMYLKLSGPSEQENYWWKNLKPGEKFVSVSAAISISDNITNAIEEMTKYRRHIANRSKADIFLPVIFNDYMECLNADPTTEKELEVIDAAAELGAEVYCMDAGWYADGTWWETVGEWKVFEPRFPNGMKEVFDYIKSKGMIGGIWLEPESIGIKCPILDEFGDDCFFMRHGKRVIDHGRYHFDFRNKKVTDFLDGVVDGLIKDYGIGYFKFDYNIDGGIGTEFDADSFGDGLMQHNAAYLNWIDGIYKRHPDLIIENCASGGMRMDYKTLQHFSIQSLTDATNYETISSIAAMSSTAVIPEQSAVWCLPKREDSKGEIASNMVNAMFKRVHLSGESPWINDEQKAIVKEGIMFYKSVRHMIPDMHVFYPMGLCDFNSDIYVVGYTNNEKSYICICNIGDDKTISIPIKTDCAKIVYPKLAKADIVPDGENINVSVSAKSSFVLEIYL